MQVPPLPIRHAEKVKSWVPHPLSSEELTMIENMASLPFVYKHVALMPDAHLGIGAMVGSVVATKDAIIPAAVGVDIGCGMMARKLNVKASALEGKLGQIRSLIEAKVPLGPNGNKHIDSDIQKWKGWKQYHRLHPKVKKLEKTACEQLGSLGGGNHFIELCIEPDQPDSPVWVMLHSGSRKIGNALAQEHIKSAKQLRKLSDQKAPDPDLAHFVCGSAEFNAYWHDLQWAQKYALRNREVMMERILAGLAKLISDGEPFRVEFSVNCHHNYAERDAYEGEEVYVTRKGAVRAGQGEYGIIPGSMGTRSFIVRGKGAAESFCSCSHGAGRQMSRSQAKKRFSEKDLLAQTEGVECRKDRGVLDEIPGAYKDIDTVMEAQKDLVEVIVCLKQIVCVKG